jgi:glucoamylase
MLANPQFLARSVGFVGVSDGWQQLRNHRRLTDQYDTANDGNVALSAELAMEADGASVLAVVLAADRLTPRVSASASTQSAQG